MKNESWNPTETCCVSIVDNDYVFVEKICNASDEKTNLIYGKIISCDNKEWLKIIVDCDTIIMFKENGNKFNFFSSNDGYAHCCYAIKPEEILGRFHKSHCEAKEDYEE